LPERCRREEALVGFTERLRQLVIPPEMAAWLQGEFIGSDQSDKRRGSGSLQRLHSDLDRLHKRLDILNGDRLDPPFQVHIVCPAAIRKHRGTFG